MFFKAESHSRLLKIGANFLPVARKSTEYNKGDSDLLNIARILWDKCTFSTAGWGWKGWHNKYRPNINDTLEYFNNTVLELKTRPSGVRSKASVGPKGEENGFKAQNGYHSLQHRTAYIPNYTNQMSHWHGRLSMRPWSSRRGLETYSLHFVHYVITLITHLISIFIHFEKYPLHLHHNNSDGSSG